MRSPSHGMDTHAQNNQIQPVVHCGNLSSKTTSSELLSIFSKVAPVIKISLKRKGEGLSAFAFVTFPTMQDAENIVKEFNFHSLHNKQMNLTIYNAEKDLPAEGNIFVKNLPPNLNSKDLNEIFKMFGQIVSCKVASNESGELKGFGYVQYKNAKSAKKAIANCKNVKIGSHTLEVELYDPKLKEVKMASEPAKATFTNCYIKNFPNDMTEPRLRSILEKHGIVSSLYFPVKENGASVGYACANFTSPEEANKAIENLHNKNIFNANEVAKEEGLEPEPFYIQKAEKKQERIDSLKKQVEMLSLEGQRSKRNLYVSNIPDSFSKDEIKNIFLNYGKIIDFKISGGSPNSSKQYGYVCYATAEEACVAFEKIDGTFLDGNKLQISYYKNKHERLLESDSAKTNHFLNNDNSFSVLKSSSQSDMKSSGSGRKAIHNLYNLVLAAAKTYKGDWESLGVQNEVEFAQKITKSCVDLPDSSLKEMASDSVGLDDHIKKIISNSSERKVGAFKN